MKPFQPRDLSALLVALATAAFLATNSVHAFTIDTQSGTNADGSAKFVDPDEEIENFASGKNAFKQGSGLFNFDFKPFFDAGQRNSQFGSGYPRDRMTPGH